MRFVQYGPIYDVVEDILLVWSDVMTAAIAVRV